MATDQRFNRDSTPKRAAVYVRISEDRDGESQSPERQEEDCRKFADAHKWQVSEVYEDRDLSASKPDVKRPGYEKMLEDIENGEIDGVLFWKLDRLGRSVNELLRVFTFFDDQRIPVASYNEQIDTASSMGRFIFVVMAGLAQLEAETTALRVRRAARGRAEKGLTSGGGSRPFGWEPDGMTIRESEAALLRDAAQRVIGGTSLRQIAREWNVAGIKPAVKELWSPAVLSHMLRSDRNSGWRVHRKGTPEEERFKAAWPPIFDEDLQAELQIAFAENLRLRAERIQQNEWVLTRFVRCGVCDATMHAFYSQGRGKPRFARWRCRVEPGRKSCGSVSIAHLSLEQYVMPLVFIALTEMEPPKEQSGFKEQLQEVRATLERDKASLAQLVRERALEGLMPEGDYSKLVRELSDRIREAESFILSARPNQPKFVIPPTVEETAKWWAALDAQSQRAALSMVLNRVVISPTKRRGGNRFDESRVRIEWN